MIQEMNNKVAPIDSVHHQAWKPEQRKPRRRSIIREFALNTSTHGLPGIARSESKHNCLFWTASFVVFLAVMTFFITQSIRDYFSYPTQTTLSYVVERSQAFPAVTFCNYMPARYDHLIIDVLNYTNSLGITNTSDTTTFTVSQAVAIREFLRHKLDANQSITEYFFSIDSMLINCTYNNLQCTSSDFITFLSSRYGSCYTFNAKLKNTSYTGIRYTNDNGGVGQLKLRLYAHSSLYVPYISEEVAAGMVVMIHDNTQFPQIDIVGMNLAPGFKHQLNYRKKANYFLSAPYTDCTDKIPLAMKAMFDRYEGAHYAYSQSACFTLCVQAYIYQECGCVSPVEWSARSVAVPGTNRIVVASLCAAENPCYTEAAIRLSNSTDLWDEFCSDCTQECTKIEYLVTPSLSKAPSTYFAYVTKAFVEASSVPLPTNWSTNWITEVEQNFVSVEIMCESIQVENYTQEASLNAAGVLSNVGGLSGLWIGVSFLSIMEFVEMLYRLLRRQYQIYCYGA
ncbi:unnamed protein product [Adineta ricciae]|uniref:Uncharacterized protein n=1 Tax=Adineta ricciae TaxID=249248 RepID=A0A813U796_ADIRI|nr:unnamed protein product [Adineta ricciae]